MNKDGFLDINELGDSIAEDYQDKFDHDEQLWVKMTSDSWINQEELIKSLVAESQRQDIEELIKLINFEDNPNVTLWQFVRAKGKDYRNKLDEIIEKHPLMIEENEQADETTQETEAKVEAEPATHEEKMRKIFSGFDTLGEFLEEESPFDPKVIAKKFEEERKELRKYIEECGIPRAQVVIDVKKMKARNKRPKGPPPGMMPPWMKPGKDGKMPPPPWLAQKDKDGNVIPPKLPMPMPPQPKLYDFDDEIPDFYDNDILSPPQPPVAPPTKEQQEIMRKQMEHFMNIANKSGGALPQFADDPPSNQPNQPVTPKTQPLVESRTITPQHGIGIQKPITIRGQTPKSLNTPGKSFGNLKRSTNVAKVAKIASNNKPMSKSYVGASQRIKASGSEVGRISNHSRKLAFANNRNLTSASVLGGKAVAYQNPFAKNKFSTGGFATRQSNTNGLTSSRTFTQTAGTSSIINGNKEAISPSRTYNNISNKKTITGSPLRQQQQQKLANLKVNGSVNAQTATKKLHNQTSPTTARRIVSPTSQRYSSPINGITSNAANVNSSPINIRNDQTYRSRVSTTRNEQNQIYTSPGRTGNNRAASPLNNTRSNNLIYSPLSNRGATSPQNTRSGYVGSINQQSSGRVSGTYGGGYNQTGVYSPNASRGYGGINRANTYGNNLNYSPRGNYTGVGANYGGAQNSMTSTANRFMSPTKTNSFGGATSYVGGGAQRNTGYVSPNRSGIYGGGSRGLANQYSPRATGNNWGNTYGSGATMRTSMTGSGAYGATGARNLAGGGYGTGYAGNSSGYGRMSASHIY